MSYVDSQLKLDFGENSRANVQKKLSNSPLGSFAIGELLSSGLLVLLMTSKMGPSGFLRDEFTNAFSYSVIRSLAEGLVGLNRAASLLSPYSRGASRPASSALNVGSGPPRASSWRGRREACSSQSCSPCWEGAGGFSGTISRESAVLDTLEGSGCIKIWRLAWGVRS